MNSSNEKLNRDLGLDADIVELLAEQQAAYALPVELKSRMRARLLDQVQAEEAAIQPGFKTIRAHEGEWLEPLPGAKIKILHAEADGLLTYLARLSPGFEMQGHPHPHPEECLMLEGDLWLGNLRLQAGDYHFAERGLHHGRLRTEQGALVLLKGALPPI
jgi:quercetin dioxygenase-like cupin family protein